jgi:hypothetical protein
MADRPATKYEVFINNVNIYKNQLVRLGARLADAKENRDEWIGGEMSWADFVAQPEVGMSVREANGLIKLFEWLCEVQIPVENLNLATARFAASKDILDPELHEDMKVLSLKDFKDRHFDVVKKQDNAPQTYDYMVMKRSKETGTLSRVYDENVEKLLEDIKEKIHE